MALSVVCGVKLTKMDVVKKQIEIHESENDEIEQEIAELVSNYQKHEQNTFEDLKPESAMVALSLYPELKSDALVQAQIEIYTQNRKDIIALKDELTKNGYYAWWLYFGKGE